MANTNLDTSVYFESYEKHKGKPLMILIGLYKGMYSNFFWSTFFYIIKHSPVWVLPIVTANIINSVTNADPNVYRIIALDAALMVFLLILNVPMNQLHIHFRSRAVRKVEAGLRSALVHKIQVLSIPHQKEMLSGRLQSKIIRDVESVETLSDQLFVSLINIFINVIVALSVTISKSIIVFLFFLFTVPIAAVLVVSFKKPIKKHNQKFRKEMEETSAKVMEMVQLVPVTRAHGLENEEINRMDTQVDLIAQAGYSLDIIQGQFGAVSWAIFQIAQVLCLTFTAVLSVTGKVQVGDVVLYQSYFTTIVGQISSLLTLLPIISKGLESVTSIGEILESPYVEDTEGKSDIGPLKGEFDFENIGYAYPDSQDEIISGLTFHVEPGETVAFVGESGAGKSTIMNLLVGFGMPSSGRLLIDGRDIKDISLQSYRRQLAVVPQNTILFSGTIRDNILYGTNDISEEKLSQVIEEAGLKSVIDKLPAGLDTVVGEHGDKLSGGQKQRISIARALIRNPKVILLDEATSALDAISEKEVSYALDHISSKCTTFIVAHRLATIEKADKIIVIDNGTIAEVGSFKELMDKKGIFYRMEMTK
ncbi:MAG: ABC transporter ATP-binding protein [Butyrivibrio sp.]|uniref:ABC transporter ATP-binding protein n=1 Tax=Butyrivibrio sp. TaxID=28121 RepID=UPI001B7436D3|nr:ABC transporter ATP-binding protein [Butyrivibrio sp.]MBP3782942.1 ABC transporter ATP-binding protein [Butyrivibrio sp.]